MTEEQFREHRRQMSEIMELLALSISISLGEIKSKKDYLDLTEVVQGILRRQAQR